DALNGNGTITNGAAATSVTLTLGSCGGSGTFAGVIQNGNGTLGLTKVGAGTQTLSGTVAYTGATAVNAGTLVFTSSSALASLPTVTVAAGTVLCLNTAGALTLNAAVSGDGGLAVEGGGTVTMMATSTYGGDTQLIAGTLRAGRDNVFSTRSHHRIRTQG